MLYFVFLVRLLRKGARRATQVTDLAHAQAQTCMIPLSSSPDEGASIAAGCRGGSDEKRAIDWRNERGEGPS